MLACLKGSIIAPSRDSWNSLLSVALESATARPEVVTGGANPSGVCFTEEYTQLTEMSKG